MNEANSLTVKGHVLIRDADSGEIILDKTNAVHLENMSEALALSIAHRGYGQFNTMAFGNGASVVSGTGAVTYFPPNVTGRDAGLYNATYTTKVIDDNNSLNNDTSTNFEEVVHVDGTTYSDIVIHAYLNHHEPAGQEAFDDADSVNGAYVFDELGIYGYPKNGVGTGKLLTHCIFNPIQKSINRAFEIVYTLRIYMSQ